jgi:2-polyprenyl-6-methoxyphenol hydroxylase-like FAD-dependent oxidoreductase
MGMVGQRAVIVGAGVGGLASAAALAPYFSDVILVDRDRLPASPAGRSGTPQCWHAHGLLAGGLEAFNRLLPGLDEDLARAGAVELKLADGVLTEMPGFDPFPPCTADIPVLSISRPLLEHVFRRRVFALGNVALREATRVLSIEHESSGDVTGVCVQDDVGTTILPADLVIDASGRNVLGLSLCESVCGEAPPVSSVDAGLKITTSVLRLPAGTKKGIFITLPAPPEEKGAGYIFPVEDDLWLLCVLCYQGEEPPSSFAQVLTFLKGLRTSTLFDVVKEAECVGEIRRFGFGASTWTHFERCSGFPGNFIPVGDAYSRFNPVYGQGMTVAGKEALLLRDLCDTCRHDAAGLAGLSRAFLEAASPLVAAAWSMSALPGFAYPETRGERPDNVEDLLRYGFGLLHVAADDMTVNTTLQRVRHFLESPEALQTDDLRARVGFALNRLAAAA